MRIGIIIAVLVVVAGFIFWKDLAGVVNGKPSVKSAKHQDEKNKTKQPSPGVRVSEKWDLPVRLREISGLAYLDEQRFLCVQDEEGILFIYNRSEDRIEKEIPFASAGDYEGIAVNDNTAYVVRADGLLYEVNMQGNKTREHKTPLTADHNVEGLCFDKSNNRLLLAIKDKEPGNKNYKGIYAFDLAGKKFIQEPEFKVEMDNPVLKNIKKKVKPSAIGIHPLTGDMYITDGPASRLLLMDGNGEIKKLLELGPEFEQPEGVTFSPHGEIFISNEGTKNPGNIIKIKLDN